MDNIKKCKGCGKLEVRKQCGFFPGGRNKKWVNDNGGIWNGLKCPDCNRSRVKDSIKQKRADAKSGNES